MSLADKDDEETDGDSFWPDSFACVAKCCTWKVMVAVVTLVSIMGIGSVVVPAKFYHWVVHMLNGRSTTLNGASHSTAPKWIIALLLAISSSTDNFAVGLSVALAGCRLKLKVNFIIAVCNAMGALSSAGFGQIIGGSAPTLAPALAGAIFMYLAWEELASWRRGEHASPLTRQAADGMVWRLAVPMTLNNLAGGVASGVVGVGPIVAGGCALAASFVMMASGHCLGRTLGHVVEKCLDPRLLAVTVFASVALVQLVGAVQAAVG